MNEPTIVTGLYDINRHNFKKYERKFESYLQWFQNCLSLDCNMVIFVEENLVDFVKKHRSHLPEEKTKIICKKLEEFRFYKYKDRMKEVMDSENFKREPGNELEDPQAPELSEPLYNVVTYSKVSMLREVAELNPFNSDYFLWVDAGCMHTRFPIRYKNMKFPSPDMLKILDPNKFYLTCRIDPTITDLNLKRFLKKKYQTKFYAFVIGANKDKAIELDNFFDSYLNEVLNMNLINAEQSALTIFYLRNKKDIKKFNIQFISQTKNFSIYTGFLNLISPALR